MNMGKTLTLNSIKKKFSPEKEDMNYIIKNNPKSAIYKLAIPSLISLLFLNINGLMDSMWVSGLGQNSLAGIGFILSIFTIIVGVGTGLSTSTNAILSSAISKGDHSLAHKIIINSLIVTLIIGISIALLLVIFLKPILLILNAGPALGPALDYGYIVFGGMFVFFYASVVPSILKSNGNVKKVTYAMVLTSFLNVILDPILIYGLNLGIKGAAIATLFCSVLCCMILSYFIFDKNDKKINPKTDFKINSHIIWDLVSLAVPITFESVILSMVGLIYTVFFNIIGSATDVAIYTVVTKVQAMAIIPVIAISSSMVTVTAYLSTSSLNLNKIKEIVIYTLKISVIISIVLWIIIVLLNNLIVAIFSGPESTALFKSLLGICMDIMLLTIVPLSIGLIATSIMQGLKYGKISLILSFSRSILFEFIFSLIFVFVFHLGTLGVYYGILVGSIIGAIICYIVSKSHVHKFFKKLSKLELQNT
jgi:putative MATE family efflux protein